MARVVFDVDDTSPAVLYSPFRDTLALPNLSTGWNPYFNESGFAQSQGSTGVGTSQHITSLDGAQLSIQWNGTGIALYGNTTSSTFSINLDGANIQLSIRAQDASTLISIDNLQDQGHVLTLIAQISPDQSPGILPPMVVFDKAVITAPIPSTSPDTSVTSQVLNDSIISFDGIWSLEDDIYVSRASGDRANLSFQGTSLQLVGTTSPEAGNYSVSLDGAPKRFFDARSSFLQPGTLLFFASGLNPRQNHTFEIINEDGSSLMFPVGGLSANVSSPSSPPPASSESPSPEGGSAPGGIAPGTIAALVLGGVLAFILLGACLFVLVVYVPRRRRRRAAMAAAMAHERPSSPGKGDEAGVGGVVLDISPEANLAAIPIEEVPRVGEDRGRRRSSGRSGFVNWKREMEGRLRLSGFGITFRHSGEAPQIGIDAEKTSNISRGSSRIRRLFSLSRSAAARSSPSFTIDLPLPQVRAPPSAASGSVRSGNGRENSSSRLSYMSTPSYGNTERQPSNNHARTGSGGQQLPPLSPVRAQQEDRGSVREVERRAESPSYSQQAAIRSLSPSARMSEHSSPSNSPIETPRPSAHPFAQQPLPSPARTSTTRRLSRFLPSIPLNLDFRRDSRRISTGSRVRFKGEEDKRESGVDLDLGTPVFGTLRLTPPTAPAAGSSNRASFLDLSAHSDASTMTSSAEGSPPPQQRSRWSSTTAPGSLVFGQPQEQSNYSSSSSQSQAGNASTSNSNSSPSAVFPFPTSMPASPHHPEGARPSPPRPLPVPGQPPALNIHPPALHRFAAARDSPTDSVPVSVSDLNFRHRPSSESETDANNGALPPHPPLPHIEDDDRRTTDYVLGRVLGRYSPEHRRTPSSQRDVR